MTKIEFIKKYWQYLAMVVLLVVGFVAGANLNPQPERVVEKVRIEQVEKQVVVVQEKVRVEIVKVKDTQVVERWHREKTETKTPDGAVVTKEVEDKNIDTLVKEKENNVEVRVVEVEKQVVVIQKQETEKIIDNQKRFRVGLLVGVHPDILPVPKINSYAVGGELDVRIIGPVWIGAWGMGTTAGQALGGLAAGVEF